MSAKRLNSATLPSITGLEATRAEIAQAQHGGAVGDHRDHVALGGVVVGERRIAGDVQAGLGDAGRIGERQVARRGHRLGDAGFQLAGPAAGMQREGLLGRDARGARVDGAVGHDRFPTGAARLCGAHHAGRERGWKATGCAWPPGAGGVARPEAGGPALPAGSSHQRDKCRVACVAGCCCRHVRGKVRCGAQRSARPWRNGAWRLTLRITLLAGRVSPSRLTASRASERGMG